MVKYTSKNHRTGGFYKKHGFEGMVMMGKEIS